MHRRRLAGPFVESCVPRLLNEGSRAAHSGSPAFRLYFERFGHSCVWAALASTRSWTHARLSAVRRQRWCFSQLELTAVVGRVACANRVYTQGVYSQRPAQERPPNAGQLRLSQYYLCNQIRVIICLQIKLTLVFFCFRFFLFPNNKHKTGD